MAKRKPSKNLPADFDVAKTEATQLTLFIPSGDRFENPIDQPRWEQLALELLGTHFGGATAFPKGHGVWRDDARDGKLVFDETIVVQCYTNRKAWDESHAAVRQFLVRMGTETNQGAVGLVVDQIYMEIRFPLNP